jgi:hypothetical protein
MTTVNDAAASGTGDGDAPSIEEPEDPVNVLGGASVALSAVGFLTLLRLADRRDRAPARTFGLFLTTSLATIIGTVFGLIAVRHATDSEQPGKGLLLGASGAMLGIITTLLSIRRMRIRHRL